jgi:autotransporter-associated beta strand protein
MAAAVFAPALPSFGVNDLYWDTNGGGTTGTTSGTNGNNGTWGTSNFWNTSSTGDAGTFTNTTNNTNDVHFAAGTNSTGASTVTVSGTQDANSIFFEEANITLSGGTVRLGAGGGANPGIYNLNAGVSPGQPVISSALVLAAPTITISNNPSPSRTITINGGITSTGSSDLILQMLGTNPHILIQTGTVNHSGSITTSDNGGGSASDIIINSVIGPNVTGITHNATDPFILGGANTFSGPTDANATGPTNSIRLANALALQNSTVSVNDPSSVTFATGIGTFTVGGLTGLSSFALADIGTTPAPITLQAGNNNADTTFGGVMSGAGSLTKIGNGKLTLSNTNTYSGATQVNAGTLLVSGTLSNSAVTVNSGGTLSGTGNVPQGVTVVSGGTLAPGASPGILNTGSISLTSGANYSVELNGLTVGTQYDRTAVIGTVDLGGSNLLISVGFTPSSGDTFVVITNNLVDPVIGTFGNTSPSGYIAGGGQFFQVIYNYAGPGGDGNDVALTFTNVPEPGGTIAAILCTAGGAVLGRRRRHRATA